ncbi:hypothetical protein [Geomonas subterranea]|uniref:hypothetical protein n=1 Tax=Geomonas subterranea TaxID=2847989 RepID=UPI001CD417C1|nr:hypothetical protein [Geomonas fuzhouensis]
MPYDPHLHHRRSVRLEGFDYSQNGAYFVTVCAHERQTLFGRLVAGDAGVTVELSEAGAAAQSCWLEIPRHFPLVTLDAFIVMPDHLHGILFLSGREQSLGRVRGGRMIIRPYRETGHH